MSLPLDWLNNFAKLSYVLPVHIEYIVVTLKYSIRKIRRTALISLLCKLILLTNCCFLRESYSD
jgi:hypothetical protein